MPTVLLVDDDEGNRTTISALLEVEGFDVHVAASCGEARTLLGGTASVEVVLLDQHLGDGKGSDLVPAIRSALPRAKIVLVSGRADGNPASVDAYFQKGGAFQELLEVVRGALGS